MYNVLLEGIYNYMTYLSSVLTTITDDKSCDQGLLI